MPFGLCNAPATFQRTMNLLLHDHENTQVFINDITVFSSTLEEHYQHLDKRFKKLRDEHFTQNDPNVALLNQKLNSVAT